MYTRHELSTINYVDIDRGLVAPMTGGSLIECARPPRAGGLWINNPEKEWYGTLLYRMAYYHCDCSITIWNKIRLNVVHLILHLKAEALLFPERVASHKNILLHSSPKPRPVLWSLPSSVTISRGPPPYRSSRWWGWPIIVTQLQNFPICRIDRSK